MNIAYVTTEYNWNSFSASRCGYETLKNLGIDVDIFFEKDPDIFNYDQIWLMSSGYYLTDNEYEKVKGKVISFGLSEPCKLPPEKRRNYDIYCSNDLKICQEMGYYWFPTSCDIRYHKNLNLKKEIDVIFIGFGLHSTADRIKIIQQLRESGIEVKTCGNGWPNHKDNFGRIDGNVLVENINKARLVLDIATKTSSLARRVFEGLACGVAVLTCDREDIRKLFIANEEILVYQSLNDIVSSVKNVISNNQLLKRISENGQLRCIREHDISHRITSLLKYLET